MRRECPYHCNRGQREKREDPGDVVVLSLSVVTIPGVFAKVTSSQIILIEPYVQQPCSLLPPPTVTFLLCFADEVSSIGFHQDKPLMAFGSVTGCVHLFS